MKSKLIDDYTKEMQVAANLAAPEIALAPVILKIDKPVKTRATRLVEKRPKRDY